MSETKKPIAEGNNPEDKKPDEVVETESTEEEFEKELADLESGKGAPPAPQEQRSELEKATFTAKSTLKRIKELGGDPNALLGEEAPRAPAEKPQEVDTSKFVTKRDLATAKAQEIAKSPNELKLIMWYVDNKGMSVEDAHFMANKNRIRRTLSEVRRGESAIPAAPGAGAGQRRADKPEAPDLPESEKRRLEASGMKYDPAKMAYVGKKVQHRYDPAAKGWVTERI